MKTLFIMQNNQPLTLYKILEAVKDHSPALLDGDLKIAVAAIRKLLEEKLVPAECIGSNEGPMWMNEWRKEVLKRIKELA